MKNLTMAMSAYIDTVAEMKREGMIVPLLPPPPQLGIVNYDLTHLPQPWRYDPLKARVWLYDMFYDGLPHNPMSPGFDPSRKVIINSEFQARQKMASAVYQLLKNEPYEKFHAMQAEAHKALAAKQKQLGDEVMWMRRVSGPL